MLSLFAICVALCWTFGVSECELGETEHTDAQGNTHCMKLLSTVLRSANPECSIEEQSLWINVAAQSNEIFYMNAAHWNVTDATVRNHLQVNDVTVGTNMKILDTNGNYVVSVSEYGLYHEVPVTAVGGLTVSKNGVSSGYSIDAQVAGDLFVDGHVTKPLIITGGAFGLSGSGISENLIGQVYTKSSFGQDYNPPYFNTALPHDVWYGLALALNAKISLRTSYSIYSSNLVMASDERIKKDISTVPDNLALDIVRALDTKYYHYRDTWKRGPNRTIGFIAQEVMDAIPEAVSLNQDFVPDEMRPVKASWNNNIMTLDETLEPGVYRFYVANTPTDDQRRVDELMKDWTTIDGKTFETDGKQFDNVFLYGRRINDFHVIDKQKIFAVAYSALQQVDKNQQALQNKVRSLEATVLELSSRLSNLENQ